MVKHYFFSRHSIFLKISLVRSIFSDMSETINQLLAHVGPIKDTAHNKVTIVGVGQVKFLENKLFKNLNVKQKLHCLRINEKFDMLVFFIISL